MASRFTALPLASGEAFLLVTTHNGEPKSILVDSGRRNRQTGAITHPLVAAIRGAEPRLRSIDIAVCTHHDLDHAGGFRTFADAWCAQGGRIGEFWLPGRWSAALPGLLFGPAEFADRLWRGALEFVRTVRKNGTESPRATLEERLRQHARDVIGEGATAAEGVAEQLAAPSPSPRSEADEFTLECLAEALGVTTAEITNLHRSFDEADKRPSDVLRDIGRRAWMSPIGRWPPLWQPDILSIYLFTRAIKVARTIACITENAINNRIRIRWFDFGLFERRQRAFGGCTGLLEPVSAVELRRPPAETSSIALLFRLVLSTQNVESLVFIRPESDDEPGVMFLGDSRLCFGVDRPGARFPMPSTAPKRRIVATAPHHGSRVNDAAYDVLHRWLGHDQYSPIFVRNGGQQRQRVGRFLGEPNRCPWRTE